MRCRPSEDVCLEHSRPLIGERFCADGCKHERRAQHNEPCSVRGPRVLVKSLRCLDCSAWLSLGPARDDGEHKQRVAMELRAAQLANTPKGAYVRNGEAAGWDAHVTGDDVPWDGSEESCHWHAGYLARAIATHTEET